MAGIWGSNSWLRPAARPPCRGPQHLNFNGRCHGGAIFSLGDMALGLACNSHGTIAALIDGNISISTGVEPGDWLVAHATEVSRSRKVGVYRVDVSRASDQAHIACLSGTVYVTGKPVPVAAPGERPGLAPLLN